MRIPSNRVPSPNEQAIMRQIDEALRMVGSSKLAAEPWDIFEDGFGAVSDPERRLR